MTQLRCTFGSTARPPSSVSTCPDLPLVRLLTADGTRRDRTRVGSRLSIVLLVLGLGRVAEFDADGLGIGVVELVEDGKGVLPGVAGRPGIAGGVVDVAEVGKDSRFVVAVAEVPVQVEGVLVAGDGLVVAAEVVMGVAEAVPCVGLPGAVVELLEQGQGLLAVGEGLRVVAE